MNVAEYMMRYLDAIGVTHVFEVSGGMITEFLDAAARLGKPKLISCPSEQIAGFAAEGWARMTGLPGVAMATSGPGATNLITPIASCYFDSTPAIFITGQVRTDEMKWDRGCRQLGFQETDIARIVAPITKDAISFGPQTSIDAGMNFAFSHATRNRPGPVLIDVPFNVSRQDMPPREIAPVKWPEPTPTDPSYIADVEKLIRQAKRPLVLIGGGCAFNRIEVRQFLNRLWVPVVHSLMAKDILTTDHPLNDGFIGSYGNRWANKALAACDVLLVLGSRLDVRQTGSIVEEFTKGKIIIRVDVDSSEDRVPSNLFINSDVGAFCDAAFTRQDGCNCINVAKLDINIIDPWFAQIAEWRSMYPSADEQSPPGVQPHEFMRELSTFDHSNAVGAWCVDVGQHQMWAAQSIWIDRGQRFLTSGGHGAMGSALPMAIGAALAMRDVNDRRCVVAIVGDGGFQMSAPALHTIARLDLPIKIVVMNNGGHGMVRQFQDQYYDGHRVSTGVPFAGVRDVSSSYEIHTVETTDELFASRHASLLEVMIDPNAQALPKLSYGRGLDDMDPRR